MSYESWLALAAYCAGGYALATLQSASKRHPLNGRDAFMLGTIAVVFTVAALMFIFGHDYARALVCAAVIAAVGAAYGEQGRRAREVDARAPERARWARRPRPYH